MELGVQKAKCVALSHGTPQEAGTWLFPYLRECVLNTCPPHGLALFWASQQGPFSPRPQQRS